MTKKYFIICLIILLSIISIKGSVETNFTLEYGLTDNIYKNWSNIEDSYVDGNMVLFYSNKAFTVESVLDYINYFENTEVNFGLLNIEPRYIYPLSLKSDLIFRAGLNYQSYYNTPYITNGEYNINLTYRYDTLFSFRNNTSIRYNNRIFPDNNLDYYEFKLNNETTYYIDLYRVVNVNLLYGITCWQEKDYLVNSVETINEIPKDNYFKMDINYENFLSQVVVLDLFVEYEYQKSDLNSVIEIESEDIFEKDIYSYNSYKIGNSLDFLFENMSIKLLGSYEIKKYKSRNAMDKNNNFLNEKVFNNIYYFDIHIAKEITKNLDFILNFNYEINDSNDYYKNGNGYDLNVGISY